MSLCVSGGDKINGLKAFSDALSPMKDFKTAADGSKGGHQNDGSQATLSPETEIPHLFICKYIVNA